MLRVVTEPHEVGEAIESFGSTPVAVKPSGLTGGKGVKVMGPHLASHAEARDYALSLLARRKRGESVLIEEKIVGAEFTIQAISDGRTVLFPPATYDYPFRFDGDEGPGTGGMGSLSMADVDAALHDRPTLRAGLLDHRAGHRAAGPAGAPFHRGHEQRLLRHRRRRQGDRVQRPLRRSRVHEHHEPLSRQLARGHGAASRAADFSQATCRCARKPRSCCISSRPTTRCVPGAPMSSTLDQAGDRSGRLPRLLRLGRQDRREHLSHGRHLARGCVGDHGADARGGAGADRRLRRLGAGARSGAGTWATRAISSA